MHLLLMLLLLSFVDWLHDSGTPAFLARCRQQGLGVINAGHTVKFTPHFELTSKEVGAMAEAFDRVCRSYL